MKGRIDFENLNFRLAQEYVNQTSRHIFLTGKAGTGKTTFLKHIVKTSPKQVLVSAPTGVAAINAGGVTLHSLFQLPLEPYIPHSRVRDKFRFNRQKLKVIQQAQLLIIDEVSMLRADTLDAIDATLQYIRRNAQPFGGLQMLYIGDLFQLPPIVKEDEWHILKPYYKSAFFFHAKVIEQAEPVYIEFKKVFRQTQQTFIQLLNRVRNNEVSKDDIRLLNSRYIPDFTIDKCKKPITLCTHNAQAEQINSMELEAIKEPLHVFEGEITGEFSEYALPTEIYLQLKKKAKIMFIRNDSQEPRRYFNGKIAVITRIDKESIFVLPEGSQTEIKLEKEIWENIRYGINEKTNEITEEIIGSFKQYPVRLAWAITIHKSQGLTFDHVVIDLARAFAAGQAYVALSRCTSLDGIVLQSPIESHCIQTDTLALAFSLNELPYERLQEHLKTDKEKFLKEQLVNHFDFTLLLDSLENFKWWTSQKMSDEFQAAHALAKRLYRVGWELRTTAQKFQEQLNKRLQFPFDEQTLFWLKQRCTKAIDFFYLNIKNDILTPFQQHTISFSTSKKAKSYCKFLQETETNIITFATDLTRASYGKTALVDENLVLPPLHLPELDNIKPPSKGMPVKGYSQRLSLQMFSEGNSVKDIAKERQLTVQTIETHLIEFIKTGEVEVVDLVPLSKVNQVLTLIRKALNPSSVSVAALKTQLGSGFSYNQIRAVVIHYQRFEQQSVGDVEKIDSM
jgi:hypothetical protein